VRIAIEGYSNYKILSSTNIILCMINTICVLFCYQRCGELPREIVGDRTAPIPPPDEYDVE
jgi:hypothetical protein